MITSIDLILSRCSDSLFIIHRDPWGASQHSYLTKQMWSSCSVSQNYPVLRLTWRTGKHRFQEQLPHQRVIISEEQAEDATLRIPRGLRFSRWLSVTLRTTPDFTSKRKPLSDVAEQGSDSPILDLLSGSCFLTFTKPSGSSPSTSSCSKALEPSQSSATLFLLVCPTGKPSHEGHAPLCFLLLARAPPIVCCPQGGPDGVWPGLDSPPWCKADPRKAAQHAIHTCESKRCPSFPLKVIYLIK